MGTKLLMQTPMQMLVKALFGGREWEYTRGPEPSKVSQQPASDQEKHSSIWKTTCTRDEPTSTWAEGAVSDPV